eukprot:g6076.t1
MGAGASSKPSTGAEIDAFNELCLKYGVQRDGTPDQLVLDQIKQQWQNAVVVDPSASSPTLSVSASAASPKRLRSKSSSGDRGPVATVVSMLKSLHGSRQRLRVSLDRCAALATFIRQPAGVGELVGIVDKQQRQQGDEGKDSDGGDDSLSEGKVAGSEKAGTSSAVSGTDDDDAGRRTSGEVKVEAGRESSKKGAGGRHGDDDDRHEGYAEGYAHDDDDEDRKRDKEERSRCQACHYFICRCRARAKETQEARQAREHHVRAEERYHKLVQVQDDIRSAIGSRHRHPTSMAARVEELVAYRPTLARRVLEDVRKEKKSLSRVRAIHRSAHEELTGLLAGINQHDSRPHHRPRSPLTPDAHAADRTWSSRPGDESAAEDGAGVTSTADETPPGAKEAGSSGFEAVSSEALLALLGDLDVPCAASSRSAAAAAAAAAAVASTGGDGGGCNASDESGGGGVVVGGGGGGITGAGASSAGGSAGSTPARDSSAAGRLLEGNREVDTLLSLYCKTMQEQVSLSSLLPRLLLADASSEANFDSASQGGLYRTLKMKGRLLDAVNSRLAAQTEQLCGAIRRRKARLEEGIRGADQARLQAVGKFRAELQRRLVLCDTKLSQVGVLDADMATRASFVEPLADPGGADLTSKIDHLGTIEARVLELEDEADDIVLKVKKQRRRGASEESLAPERQRLHQKQGDLSRVRQERRALLSTLAGLADGHYPELVLRVPSICGEGSLVGGPLPPRGRGGEGRGEGSQATQGGGEGGDRGGSGGGGGGGSGSALESTFQGAGSGDMADVLDGGWSAQFNLPHRNFDEYRDMSLLSGGGDRHPIYIATLDEQTVVLKGFAQHNVSRRRELEKEIAVLSRLRHDALITVQALVVDEAGRPPTVYIELPYYREGNLEQWLRAGEYKHGRGGNAMGGGMRGGSGGGGGGGGDSSSWTSRTPWQMQSIMHQVLCGVVHLHDHGIVHKDIKPENILIREGHRAVITDFE